jgi:hypothetical protein
MSVPSSISTFNALPYGSFPLRFGSTISTVVNYPPRTNPDIITIQELLSSQEALTTKEAADKTALQQFVAVDREKLRAAFFDWAKQGFPIAYPILSISIDTPNICVDGRKRSLHDYIEYCMGISFTDMIANIQKRIDGIQISWSFSGNSLRLHATKI